MSCKVCGEDEVMDPETGYSGDNLCPMCVAEGWDTDANGELIDPRNEAEESVVEEIANEDHITNLIE